MQSLEILRPSRPMDCTATVLSSVDLTPTIKSIQLHLDRTEFSFLPGQSVWPKFERNGQTFSKIYSIASSPRVLPRLELCVSRVGWSSAYLQDLAVGQTISVRGPYGLLTLDRSPQRPRLYIAEGSGIAPFKSHIDWLYDQQFGYPVWLIQSNPETPDQLPYQAHWRSLQQRWPQFHYLEALNCRPESVLSTPALALAEWDIDICGVGDRAPQICDFVLARGANPGQVRSEKFFAF